METGKGAPFQKPCVRPIIRAKEMFSDTTDFVFSAKRKSFPSTVMSLFQPLERTFHLLECTFHPMKCMFHQLEHKIHHTKKTFIALFYNILSTMFQKCGNYTNSGRSKQGEKAS
jgi:hypothetical protein